MQSLITGSDDGQVRLFCEPVCDLFGNHFEDTNDMVVRPSASQDMADRVTAVTAVKGFAAACDPSEVRVFSYERGGRSLDVLGHFQLRSTGGAGRQAFTCLKMQALCSADVRSEEEHATTFVPPGGTAAAHQLVDDLQHDDVCLSGQEETEEDVTGEGENTKNLFRTLSTHSLLAASPVSQDLEPRKDLVDLRDLDLNVIRDQHNDEPTTTQKLDIEEEQQALDSSDRDYRVLAVGCSDGAVRFLDLRSKEGFTYSVIQSIPEPGDGEAGLKCVDWEGHFLATGSEDGLVNVWDVRSFSRPLCRIWWNGNRYMDVEKTKAIGSLYAVHSVKFISRGKVLATTPVGSKLLETGIVDPLPAFPTLRTFPHRMGVSSMDAGPDGFVIASQLYFVEYHSLHNPVLHPSVEIFNQDNFSPAVCFDAPRGLCYASSSAGVNLYRIRDRRHLRTYHHENSIKSIVTVYDPNF
ncbi:unnamed protein product [Amoebophrya sp. A25]|nr:unnamed protein product [Amoebophrya sp. A25]|eukprot:GSA25T00008189001.1